MRQAEDGRTQRRKEGERERLENTEGGGKREGLGAHGVGREGGRTKRKSPSSSPLRSCAIRTCWDWSLQVRDAPPQPLVTNGDEEAWPPWEWSAGARSSSAVAAGAPWRTLVCSSELRSSPGSLSAPAGPSQSIRGALTGSGSVSAAAMATKIDKEACRAAYNLVRDDGSEVIWVTFRYDGATIVPGDQGADYQHFIQQCTDDVRLFAFVRFTTGDAMSKRSKFALITWIGEDVSGLQRAKTGTDKTLVKEVVQNFAKEFVISDRKELEEDFIRSELKKAGGANYDAQTE